MYDMMEGRGVGEGDGDGPEGVGRVFGCGMKMRWRVFCRLGHRTRAFLRIGYFLN